MRIIVIIAACVVVIGILVGRFFPKKESGGGNPHITVIGSDDGNDPAPTLIRKRLETTRADGGTLKLTVNDELVDFTRSAGNVFGLADGATLEADDCFRAFMTVGNSAQGAFAFWIGFKMDDAGSQDRLTVSAESDGQVRTVAPSAEATLGDANDPLAIAGGGETVDFEIELYVSDGGGDIIMPQAFDIILYVTPVAR